MNEDENDIENMEHNHNNNDDNNEKKSIPSRGIPSRESLYLPPYYSKKLRKFQDDNEIPTRNFWSVEEVINFVFPKEYQEKYNEIATKFMTALNDNLEMDSEQIGKFIKENNISKATFYNRVLPRLKRVGMVKVYRDTIISKESKRKYRPMRIVLSKTFGNYLTKIGESWLAIVDDARTRK
ncbi:hypothetical protein J7J90_00630 [Candidatus Micrarchaeota archaeon]|nr:hypothetical protein [Candidatus Micrarchaeota archaeon]